MRFGRQAQVETAEQRFLRPTGDRHLAARRQHHQPFDKIRPQRRQHAADALPEGVANDHRRAAAEALDYGGHIAGEVRHGHARHRPRAAAEATRLDTSRGIARSGQSAREIVEVLGPSPERRDHRHERAPAADERLDGDAIALDHTRLGHRQIPQMSSYPISLDENRYVREQNSRVTVTRTWELLATFLSPRCRAPSPAGTLGRCGNTRPDRVTLQALHPANRRRPRYPFTARITATHWSSIGRIVCRPSSEGRLAETRLTPASR